MVGKFYSITDESAIKRGTIISTIFAFIVAGGCYFLGGFGRLFGMPPVLPNGKLAFDSIVPSMLVTLPDVIIAMVAIAGALRLHVDPRLPGTHLVQYDDPRPHLP